MKELLNSFCSKTTVIVIADFNVDIPV